MEIEKNDIIYMLGKNGKVTDIIKTNGIYSGKYRFKNKDFKAYLITEYENEIKDEFDGKIVGIIQIKATEEIRIVVSETSSNIGYANIKGYLLGKEKDLANAKFKCLHEKSAGAIVYKIINNEPYFLIIYSKKNIPGFPKGHVEYGEKDEETAVRETKEETGLNVKLENDFKESIFYNIDDTPIQKQVVFFLGKKIEDGEVKIDETEIDNYKIMNYEEAKNILNPDLACVIELAKNYIYNKYLS